MGWQGLYYIVNGVTLHESYNPAKWWRELKVRTCGLGSCDTGTCWCHVA